MKPHDIFLLVAIGALVFGALLQAAKIEQRLKNDPVGRRRALRYTGVVAGTVALPFVALWGLARTGCITSKEQLFFASIADGWVWGWNALLFAESAILVFWVTRRGGAEFWASYPFLINAISVNVQVLKKVSVLFFAVFWLLFVVAKVAFSLVR